MKQNQGRVLFTDFALRFTFNHFSSITWAYLPWDGARHHVLGLPPSRSKQASKKMPTGQFDGGNSTVVPSSQVCRPKLAITNYKRCRLPLIMPRPPPPQESTAPWDKIPLGLPPFSSVETLRSSDIQRHLIAISHFSL